MSEKGILLFETKYWIINLNTDQAYLGRCYILARRKVETLSDLNSKEWTDFHEIIKKLESAFKKTFNAIMFNWTFMMNDAYLEKKSPQVHWHFRPRYDKKIEFAGETFEDPEFGHHYDRARKKIVSEKVLNAIADKVRKNL